MCFSRINCGKEYAHFHTPTSRREHAPRRLSTCFRLRRDLLRREFERALDEKEPILYTAMMIALVLSSFALFCGLFSPSRRFRLWRGALERTRTKTNAKKGERTPKANVSFSKRIMSIRVDRSPSKGTTRVSVASSRLCVVVILQRAFR